tara:strand:- start:2814 stop:3959 length:1146 start_codon:yes stop_codon:yes gene_type:complete
MIPYSTQLIDSLDIKAVNKVLKSSFLTQGPIVKKFEAKIENYTNSKFATSTNSATSALHIACMALDLSRNDTLWTSSISFVASANCGIYCGAKVDFLDIDIETFNIDTLKLEKKLIKAKKNKKLPKVIVLVHMGGLPCEMEKIKRLSIKYAFKIIEDASHAIGSKYIKSKIGDCKYSDLTVFSFHPVKNITTCEGGMVTTNNKIIDKKLKLFREHGIQRDFKLKKRTKDYDQVLLGYNYRMNEVQAALGIEQLKKLNKWIKYKNFLAKRYRDKLKNLPISFQKIKKNITSSYHLFIIMIRSDYKKHDRDLIFEKLIKSKIGINIHYKPIYRHSYYSKFKFNINNFKSSEYYYANCISIPMYSALSVSNQDFVIKRLKELLK